MNKLTRGQMNFIYLGVMFLRYFIVCMEIFQKLKKTKVKYSKVETLVISSKSEIACSVMAFEISSCGVSHPVTSWLKA